MCCVEITYFEMRWMWLNCGILLSKKLFKITIRYYLLRNKCRSMLSWIEGVYPVFLKPFLLFVYQLNGFYISVASILFDYYFTFKAHFCVNAFFNQFQDQINLRLNRELVPTEWEPCLSPVATGFVEVTFSTASSTTPSYTQTNN